MSDDLTLYLGSLRDRPTLITREGRYPTAHRDLPPSLESLTPQAILAAAVNRDADEVLKIEQERVISELRVRLDGLARRLDTMTLPEVDLVVRHKQAYSQSPQALSVTNDQEATTPATHTVDLRMPARGAEVLSPTRNPVATVNLAEGTYDFTMVIDGVAKSLRIEVKPDGAQDTHEDLMRRLAREINGQDSRIHAEVLQGFQEAYLDAPANQAKNRTVRLRVYSTEEGQGPDFYFSEGSQSGPISAYHLTQGLPSQAASVVVGGESRRQGTNTISLDNGHVTARMRAGGVGPVDIEVLQGGQRVFNDLKSLLESYNNLVSFLDAHGDELRPSLKDRITRPLQDMAGKFRGLELKATAQGRLKVQDGFDDTVAADYALIRQVMVGDGQDGWMPQLRQKIAQVQSAGETTFLRPLRGETNPFSEKREVRAILQFLYPGIIRAYG